MSLNRGLENGPVVAPDVAVPSTVFVSSTEPWLLTIASLELKVANLEQRVAELETLAETQGALNQKLLQTLELLATRPGRVQERIDLWFENNPQATRGTDLSPEERNAWRRK